jgi:transcription antitermination factor NusG
MPLLPKEPEIHPETLFDVPPAQAPWWVAHVRSRQEKSVARELLRAGVGYYIPQTEQVKRRGGRTFRSYLPLFSGYVFLRGTAEELGPARRHDAVVRVIEVPDQPLLHEELSQIRRLQLAGASLIPVVEYVPGDRVRIRDGVFAGYTGVVTRVKGRERLVLTVSLLRQSVAVEIDREHLRPM